MDTSTKNTPLVLKKEDASNKCYKSNINFNSLSVSVLPKDVDWTDLAGFISHKYGPFNYDFKDKSGRSIGKFQFTISYNCLGSYKGHGAYLSNVSIFPSLIEINKNYRFTCNVTASNPTNFGTETDPIASVEISIQMIIESQQYSYSSKSYEISEIAEYYINVMIRGNCQASIISAYLY